MRALRGPAGSLLASVLVAALFGGAAMALPGHPFASPDRQAIEHPAIDHQAIEHQGAQAVRLGDAPDSGHDGGAPNDPGAQGHARAEQRGDGAPGRSHEQATQHADSGRHTEVPGQGASASAGHASRAPNA